MATVDQKERGCPVCGRFEYVHFADERIDPARIDSFSYASRKQPEFMCHRLVRCEHCELVYAPTPPVGSFLSTAYAEAAYDSGIEASFAAKSYARALAGHLPKLPARHGAVDVGAGSGPLLPWLQKMGFDPVVGIEPSRAAIDAASSAVRPLLREGMFSADMLGDMRTSLICSFMTLEHVSDPATFVRTAYGLLEPGGMIAVVVHNRQSFVNRVLGLRSPIIDIEHLQLFNPKSLRMLLSLAGYQAIDLQSIANAYPLTYWLRLAPIPASLKAGMAGWSKRLSIGSLSVPMCVGNMLAIGIKPQLET